MITPISKLPSLVPETSIDKLDGERKKAGNLFADVFKNAIDNVKDTETDVARKEYLLATGQLDNPAELMIAQTKSAVAVDILVQMRNKAVEAYSELTRMNL